MELRVLCPASANWAKLFFQQKMSDLLGGLDAAPACINNILHAIKGSWEERIAGLEEVFRCLRQAGLTTVSAKKSKFGACEMEHLGHSVKHAGAQPIAK